MATDITRFRDDSFPVTRVISIDNNNVDLTGWTVYMFIEEKQVDDSVKNVRIAGVVNNPTNGEVKFFPRKEFCKDYTTGTDIEYIAFGVVGTHQYSIIREKDGYEKSDTGDYVLEGTEFVPYVDQTTQRYSKYTEKMTHYTGSVIISDRVGD